MRLTRIKSLQRWGGFVSLIVCKYQNGELEKGYREGDEGSSMGSPLRIGEESEGAVLKRDSLHPESPFDLEVRDEPGLDRLAGVREVPPGANAEPQGDTLEEPACGVEDIPATLQSDGGEVLPNVEILLGHM